MHTSEQQACPARASGRQRALAVNQRRVSAKAHNAGSGQLSHEQTLCTEGNEVNEGPKQTSLFVCFCAVRLIPSSTPQPKAQSHENQFNET